MALPLPTVQVEDEPRLRGEVQIAGKYPAAMLPGADGVFVEPPPHRLVTDGCDDGAALRLAHDVCGAQPSEGQTQRGGQLTGDGLNLDDDLRGGKPGVGPAVVALPGLLGVGERNACARD